MPSLHKLSARESLIPLELDLPLLPNMQEPISATVAIVSPQPITWAAFDWGAFCCMSGKMFPYCSSPLDSP